MFVVMRHQVKRKGKTSYRVDVRLSQVTTLSLPDAFHCLGYNL